jgi:hypothetical protein
LVLSKLKLSLGLHRLPALAGSYWKKNEKELKKRDQTGYINNTLTCHHGIGDATIAWNKE